MGRFPFNKNSCLKFWKFHVPSGMVHSGCTDWNNNFVEWKGIFRCNCPKWPDQSKWTTLKEVPNIPVRLNGNGLFYLLISNRRILFLKYWAEWSGPCYLADEMMREIYFIFFFQTQMSQFPLVSQISGCGTLLMSLFIRLAFEKNSLLFKRFSTNRNVI